MLFFSYTGRKKEMFYFISPPVLDAFSLEICPRTITNTINLNLYSAIFHGALANTLYNKNLQAGKRFLKN